MKNYNYILGVLVLFQIGSFIKLLQDLWSMLKGIVKFCFFWLCENILSLVSAILILLLLYYVFRAFLFTDEAAGIGAIFAGIAALLGVLWATSRWDERQAELKMMAASTVLAVFQECIEYIYEILLSPYTYEYDDYYPFLVPERQNKDRADRDWTRPMFLVNNKVGRLKQEIYDPMSKLTGRARVGLNDEVDKLYRLCRIINGYLQACLEDHKDAHERKILIGQYNPEQYRNDLQDIIKNVERITEPLILGKLSHYAKSGLN
ncbi:MAG: hypothetical protein M1114_00365 [Candidatus Dependentiae bacterium]|nr:hypothetical protein [Candidatus Dependentiae bacterium]